MKLFWRGQKLLSEAACKRGSKKEKLELNTHTYMYPCVCVYTYTHTYMPVYTHIL